MGYQQFLFEEYLDPIRLKAGKQTCPCCGKKMRAYRKEINKKTASLLIEIFRWCRDNKRNTFNPVRVFDSNHWAIAKMQILHYFGLISRTKHTGWWNLLPKGVDFLAGHIQIPQSVWAFNNKVILEDDAYVHIDNVVPQWQVSPSDYRFDYIPVQYRTEIPLKELKR